MAIHFIIDDGSNGKLYVRRHNNRVSFSTTGGSACWVSTEDVRKLIAELDELVIAIDSEA